MAKNKQRKQDQNNQKNENQTPKYDTAGNNAQNKNNMKSGKANAGEQYAD